MEIAELIPHIEALIFASDKPLAALEITDLLNNAFGFMEDKITLDQVESAIEGIKEKYDSDFYPFHVVQSGGGWQFLTKKEYHKTIAQLNGDKFMKRLSGAALETLAIIAYKQPVTKGEIEAIRGVSADYAIQKLLEKELIVISGRNENLPGHPLVYSTSKSFMDYFGINSPEELPKIKEVLADQIVEPTVVNGQQTTEGESDIPSEDGAPLVVSENGELIEATTQDGNEHDARNTSAEESQEHTASTEAIAAESPSPQAADDDLNEVEEADNEAHREGNNDDEADNSEENIDEDEEEDDVEDDASR